MPQTHVRDSYHERIGVDAPQGEGWSLGEAVFRSFEVRKAVGVEHHAHTHSSRVTNQRRETEDNTNTNLHELDPLK